MSDIIVTYVSKTLQLLEGAYAPNTLKSYYADTSAFVDWCSEKNIEPFPLTSAGTRMYIETMTPDYSYASIRRRLSYLRRINKLLGTRTTRIPKSLSYHPPPETLEIPGPTTSRWHQSCPLSENDRCTI